MIFTRHPRTVQIHGSHGGLLRARRGSGSKNTSTAFVVTQLTSLPVPMGGPASLSARRQLPWGGAANHLCGRSCIYPFASIRRPAAFEDLCTYMHVQVCSELGEVANVGTRGKGGGFGALGPGCLGCIQGEQGQNPLYSGTMTRRQGSQQQRILAGRESEAKGQRM
jgi:hypothetical protein